MADKKISELNELLTPADTDILPIVSGAETKKITLGNLIGGKYVRTTRFQIISSGTSGTVTLPTNSTVVLDDFGGTVDAVVAQVEGGYPTTISAKTSGGVVIGTTFDSSGNWSFSGTPSSYPVAIVYRVKQTLLNFDSTASNIWGNPNVEQVTKSDIGLSNVPNVDATQRANHTGTQLASTISDFDTAADSRVNIGISNHVAEVDPHTQYLNNTRGDARYYQKSEVDTQVSGVQGQIDTINLKLPDPEFVFVNSKTDFPTAVSGVITLADNVTYFITKTIDLTGDRLQAGNNTTIIGGSSENCILISTGLSASTALISSNYSLPMRNLSITHGTALNLDATGNPTAAIDWFGVNFTNCANVGLVESYSNFIMSDCALLSSANFTFDGTIGTVGFSNCLFSGIAGQTTLNFPSTLTITRRIRCIYSSFVAFAGATAIYVDPLAVVPVESYILDTISFSGGATYTGGIDYTDNRAFFSNCKGIVNSSAIAQMHYTNNTIENAIATQNVFEKIVGVTTPNIINQKFSHTDNRLTYTGGIARSFKITSFISANSVVTPSLIILARIALNGTTIDDSEAQVTTSSAGRNESLPSQTIVEMTTNDYIEIFIANGTNANSILVTELNVVIEALN
jgi:hypothetical protein